MPNDSRQDIRPQADPHAGLAPKEAARPARVFARRIDCAAAEKDVLLGDGGSASSRGAGVRRDDARQPATRPPRTH